MKQSCNPLHSSNNVKDFIIHCSLFIVHFSFFALTGCFEARDYIPIKMEVSTRALKFPSTGGSESFTITSNTIDLKVEVSGDASSWLTILSSPTSNDGTVTLSANPNPSTKLRTATITVSGKGAKDPATIEVTMDGAEPKLEVSVSSLLFDATNEPITFTITSNTSWSVSNNLPDWLTVSPMSGTEGETTLTATVAVNSDPSDRTATISVSEGEILHEIYVTQLGANSILEVSVTSLAFDASDASQTFTITSNTNWNVSNDLPDWLTVSPMSGPEGEMTLTATVAANAGPAQRYAIITISAGGVNHEIYVLQTEDKSILYHWNLTNTMRATLNDKGVLAISTTANAEAMPDYYNLTDRLWHSLTSSILSAVIETNVTSIGYGAFWGCSGLTSVMIPNSVVLIGSGAFRECPELTSVSIPASVSEISSLSFVFCDNLLSFNVDLGNNSYSSDAAGILYNKNKTLLFRYPPGKKDVSFLIPNTVSIIGDDAFQGCNNLSSVIIPDPVKSVGNESFAGCKNLTSLSISSAVTFISPYAFSNCTNLKDVTVSWMTPLSIDDAVFWSINLSGATLHVPAGTKALYLSAPVWGSFGNIIEVSNQLLFDMVFVQGGTFSMGCTSEQGDDCWSDELPVHQVTLSDFWIGRYEVTQAQWRAVTGDNPSYYLKGDNYPVESVSWNDIVGTSGATMVINNITYYANGFIYKLNQLTGKQYRLPTEAEWEFAARGGNSSEGFKYSGSNTVDDVAWYFSNSDNSTHPVGSKAANELGIYDMSGNVWELCSDWYGSYSRSDQNNPQGPLEGAYRVRRGGSWGIIERFVRITHRDNGTPASRSLSIGFRLVSDSN